jgi:hypothetical protein
MVRLDGVADGYRSASVTTEAPCGQTVELELVGEGRIAGRVRRADSVAVSDGQVFCWPAETRPSADAIYARQRSDHRLLVVDTASDGKFELDGLDPRVPYTVVAGANGLAPREWVLSARTGASDLEIVMWHVYGLNARVTSMQGGSVKTSWRLTREFQIPPLPESEATRVFPRSLDFQLAGLSPKTTDEAKSLSAFLGVKAAASLPDFGPLAVSISVPGYEPARWEVRFPRVDILLTEQVFSLQPTAEGWGTLVLDVVRASFEETATDSEEPWAWLVLERAHADPSRVALRSLGDHQTVDGIPYGDYRIRLEVGRLYRSPADGSSIDARIGPVDAHATFDLSDAGVVQLSIDAPNSVDPGPLTMYLFSVERHLRQPFSFSRPPYRIRAVPAGRYKLQVQRLPIGVWPIRHSDEFDVQSSQLTEVRMTWPLDETRDD